MDKLRDAMLYWRTMTSNSPTPHDDATQQEAPEPHSGPLAVALAIEREKLKLERERLEIERDKIDAAREDFEARMADVPDPDDVTFGIRSICVVAAVCLVLGGVIGFSTGLDTGRRQSPEPRKTLVSKRFVEMMISIRGFDRLPPREDETPLWQRLRNESQPASVIVLE